MSKQRKINISIALVLMLLSLMIFALSLKAISDFLSVDTLSGFALGMPIGLLIVYIIGRFGMRMSAYDFRAQGLTWRVIIGMSAGVSPSLTALALETPDKAMWGGGLLLLAFALLIFAEWRLNQTSDDFIKSIDQKALVFASYSALLTPPITLTLFEVMNLEHPAPLTLVITVILWMLMRLLIPLLGYLVGIANPEACGDESA